MVRLWEKIRELHVTFWAVVIGALWEAGERAHQERMEKGCEYCGAKPICEICYRCADWNCNAGCIFCIRQRGEPKPWV